jgi:hypothetical protein
MASSDSRKATEDLVKGFKDVFSRYTKGTRQTAFDRIFSAKGKEEIYKLVNNPARSIGLFRSLITFKEWYDKNQVIF